MQMSQMDARLAVGFFVAQEKETLPFGVQGWLQIVPLRTVLHCRQYRLTL